MPGKIELHYSPNLSLLTDSFLKKRVYSVEYSTSTLYLVNHQNRVQTLRKKYFLTGSGKISFEFPFMTYSRFLHMISNQNNVQKLILTFPQRCLFLSEIIKKNASNLTYFQYINQSFPADVLKAILTYFEEIRLNASDALLLDLKAGRLVFSTSDKLQHDLKTIFSDYLSQMTPDYLDEAEFIKQYLLHLTINFWNSYYPDLKSWIFENVSNFKSLHIKFIKHLKSLGFDIYLLLQYGNNPEIFAHKKPLFNRLREVSDHLKLYHDPSNISKSLFQIKVSGIKVQDKISIFRADQRLQEVENLAAEIKKNMMDHGWKYSQIGISSPQLKNYRSLLHAVLTRYDIPYDWRENKPLKWALPIKHLENLLKIVNENYPIKFIQSILQSSFFSYHIKLQNSGFIKILMALRFRQGKTEILNALENEKKFYDIHIKEEVQNSDEGENYQKLIEVLKELINELKFFKKPQFADSICQHLVNIIQHHRFLEQIYREAEGHHKDLAFENFEALHTFISALFAWIELSAKILPRKKYSVAEFLEVFSLLTEAESYSSCPPRHYGVQIFPLANLSGQDFAALYILGMEDGVLPDVLSFKFTHPQYLPKHLASYLPTDPLLHQRENFLEMLQFPAKLIQFSYASHYKDNPILPSLFLRELERISSSNLEKSHKIRLYTSSDILESLEIENTYANNASYGEAKVPIGFETFISAKKLHFFQHRLKVNKLREPNGGDSIWAGNLFQDKLSASWLDVSFKHKRFSPTQLDVYAKCPMLYFLQRILLAQPLEEGQEFLSPLDRGIVLHKILFRFFRNTENRDLKSLLTIANEELEKVPVPRGILWDIEKEYYLGGTNQKGQFTEFWEYEEQSSRAYLTTPRHFEWSFGELIDNLDVVDISSTETPFVWTRDGESFHFKGKIDRIELSKDGLILIVDYKTGNIPTLGEMWNGERLQLPIYLKVAQGLLHSKKIPLKIGGAAFYVIRKGKEIEKKVVFLDRTAILGDIKLSSSAQFPNEKYVVDGNPQTITEFINRVLNYSADYILNIRKGRFQHTEDPKKCRRWDGKVCDFMPLCKVNWRKQQTVIP